ncbi:hypothetical protein CDAR_507551 [Caerostris darwini]|uniref:Uncharacterized protein n=1 Tax=Caerostris darwini TaxID=1538125 RepID=A0AAV4MW62_9ARAC|nr:hypothetical protein CDAR_507551 [Caerostris darwini]
MSRRREKPPSHAAWRSRSQLCGNRSKEARCRVISASFGASTPASIRHQSRIIHLPRRMIRKQSPLFISPLSPDKIKGGKEVGRLAASRSIKKPFASPQNTVVSVSGDTSVVSQRFCLS